MKQAIQRVMRPAGLCLLALWVTCASAMAGALLLDATSPEGYASPAVSPSVLRHRLVQLNTRAATRMAHDGDSVTFHLFPDVILTASLEVQHAASDRLVAAGPLLNATGGRCVMVLREGRLSATIHAPGHGPLQVQYIGEGLHRVVEHDPDALPECGHGVYAPPPLNRLFGDEPPPAPAIQADGDPVVDILVVYTNTARSQAGGTQAMLAEIDLAIAETNDVFALSGVKGSVRLAAAHEVTYTETGDIMQDLSRVQAKGDGYLDEVHALRDESHADIVCLITAPGTDSIAGLGYVMQQPTPWFERYAFFVVRVNSLTGFHVFAHELGHNLGCAHDRGNASVNGAYPYSYGHRFDAGGTTYRTVMAYAPGRRVPHFSNPLVSYQGVPTGIAAGQPNEADNADTISNTLPVAANFRTAPVVAFSPSPTHTFTPTHTATPTPIDIPTNTPVFIATATPTPWPTITTLDCMLVDLNFDGVVDDKDLILILRGESPLSPAETAFLLSRCWQQEEPPWPWYELEAQ